MRPRLVLAALVAAIAVGVAAEARADPAADLEKAHNAYVAHQYEEAESRLRTLLDPRTGAVLDPDGVADARMYLGAALIAQKKGEAAAAVFTQLLLARPEYQPDALRVSLDAIDAFTDARAHARDQLAAIQAERVRRAQEEKARADADRQREVRRVAMLEQMASTEVVRERNSRWIALVPLGVGQFQNGQLVLGWTLLISEGLLAAGSGVGAATTYYNVSQRNDAVTAGQHGVADQYNQRAQTAAFAGDGLAAGFALVALLGVLHAELTFVPETVTTRRRELPVTGFAPRLTPGFAGLGARF